MSLPDPWTKFTYPLGKYPFPTFVTDSLQADLTKLSSDAPRRTWQTDQKSEWHDAFYRDFPVWRAVFGRFVREVIRPRMTEPFLYQNVPTFRVHQPNNLAVGEFHTDEKYNHPSGEMTYWVPLTQAYDTCSVWIADDDGELHVVDAQPGEVIEFSAATRLHGNKVNETNHSRVSFDFRCLPTRLIPSAEGPPTKHMKLRFIPGEYYAPEVVNAWA